MQKNPNTWTMAGFREKKASDLMYMEFPQKQVFNWVIAGLICAQYSVLTFVDPMYPRDMKFMNVFSYF